MLRKQYNNALKTLVSNYALSNYTAVSNYNTSIEKYINYSTSSKSRSFSSTATSDQSKFISKLELPSSSTIANIKRSTKRTPLHLKIGDKLNDFIVLEITPFSEYSITTYKLQHPSGASWYHIDTDDVVNVFSVSFRTIPTDSTGIAHILEHTTLCGSMHYPIRDPFFNMLRRSLQVFMNAMTGSDITFYPYATVNIKDYYNLLSIYTDATFNPLLTEKDFNQEGHRLSIKENGNLEFKGVVYNEMKGSMSDSSSLFSDVLKSNLFINSTYSFNSGGDPSDIVKLTYPQLKEFHKKHYTPSNALFYTYGDLNPSIAIEMVSKLVDLNVNGKNVDIKIPTNPGYVFPTSPFTKIHDSGRLSSPTSVFSTCPPDPIDHSPQHRIATAWLLPKLTKLEMFSLNIISSLLCDSPVSPMYKALIEPNYGAGYVNDNGFDSYTKESTFCIGLQGVKDEHLDKIESIIIKTLNEVAETGVGFEDDRIETIIHSIELAYKHISSINGISFLYRLVPLWKQDMDTNHAFQISNLISEFRQKLSSDKDYLKNLLRKNILNNKHQVTVRMSPDETYLEKQVKKEEEVLSKIQSSLNLSAIEDIKNKSIELEAYQNAPQNVNLLPTLTREDIPKSTPSYDCSDLFIETEIDNSEKVNTPLVIVPQPTNGVVYFRSLISLSDFLPPVKSTPVIFDETLTNPWSRFDLLPLFSSFYSKMRTTTYSTADLSEEIHKHTGGISTSSNLISPYNTKENFTYYGISSHCLESKKEKMFDLITDVMTNAKFDDLSRLQSLLSSTNASVMNTLQESGHSYARTYAGAIFSDNLALSERWSGLHQAQFIARLSKQSDGNKDFIRHLSSTFDEMGDKFKNSIYNTPSTGNYLKDLTYSPFKSSLVIPSQSSSASSYNSLLKNKFLDKLVLNKKSVSKSILLPENLFKSQFSSRPLNKTYFSFDLPIHHVALVLPTVSLNHPDAPKLSLLSRILTDSFLHKQIREKGGAYGGGCAQVSSSSSFEFYSYRDPNCDQTINNFLESVDWLLKPDSFGHKEMQEALLSVFAGIDKPKAPSQVNSSRFTSGVDQRVLDQYRKSLLNVTIDDVRYVCKVYLSDNISKMSVCAVGSPESNAVDLSKWNHIKLTI